MSILLVEKQLLNHLLELELMTDEMTKNLAILLAHTGGKFDSFAYKMN